ncbi:MmyB family transcriptional regulator [Cryobacterium aureum]|uniref:MmyB family transcriptional regulator n=1 Tax=Cryobacterium aureum TaxID=995037 RepID=UPI003F6CF1D9
MPRLSTQSELFRQRWASRDVVYHRSGLKRLHHPARAASASCGTRRTALRSAASGVFSNALPRRIHTVGMA